MNTITASNANRKFSSLLRDANNGEDITITSRGKPVAKNIHVKSTVMQKKAMKNLLLSRLKTQAATGPRNWTRDELYDDVL